uniref:Transmembrane protein n=1 Tax=Tetraselmis chuii TaxID=63592 RepID=A0A7S1X260_9CHLO|mmetsp:Transcript_22902/g.40762  ORF Transcript_22902/g.40762 Transcript_22902/m.40762 type:complete len:766 (+) Transcript_22902:255-2552(+)
MKSNKVDAESIGGTTGLTDGTGAHYAAPLRGSSRMWVIISLSVAISFAVALAVAVPLVILRGDDDTDADDGAALAGNPFPPPDSMMSAPPPASLSSGTTITPSAVITGKAVPLPSTTPQPPFVPFTTTTSVGEQPTTRSPTTEAPTAPSTGIPETTAAAPPTTLPMPQPLFDVRFPVYRAADFPDAGELISEVCDDLPLDNEDWRIAGPGLESQQDISALPGYLTLGGCLSCCGGGCQAYGRAMRGRDCVAEGETPSVTVTSDDDAPPASAPDTADDPYWLLRPPEGENSYTCQVFQTGFPAHTSCQNSTTSTPSSSSLLLSWECSKFTTVSACFACCGACSVDGAALDQLNGRDCLPPSEWIVALEGRPLIDAASGLAVTAPLIVTNDSKWATTTLVKDKHHRGARFNNDPDADYADDYVVTKQQRRDISADAAATAWERAAQGEHASVASFAWHGLQLMALGGAPPDILEGVVTAAADEVRHAAASLSVASLLRGPAEPAKSPGPLPLHLTTSESPSICGLVAAVLHEGCIEETVSAALAVASKLGERNDTGARGAALSAARDTVTAIAREEAEHSALAWRTLTWGMASGTDDEEVRDAILEAVRHAVDRLTKQLHVSVSEPPRDDHGGNGGCACVMTRPSYGLLTRAEDVQSVRQAVVRGLVLPWLGKLIRGEGLPETVVRPDSISMADVLANVLTSGCSDAHRSNDWYSFATNASRIASVAGAGLRQDNTHTHPRTRGVSSGRAGSHFAVGVGQPHLETEL